MALRHGKADSVIRTEQRDGTRTVTQVSVWLGDRHVAFYVPVDGMQPMVGDVIEWGTNHVDVTPVHGVPFRVHKIGYDFDPDAPLR